jgi:DNA-binding beta-propeller fold protein YncE
MYMKKDIKLVRKSALFLMVCLVVGLFTVAMPQIANAAGATGYQLTNTTLLGGEGEWDYLAFNNNTRQLFINRRGPGVTVFNVDTKKVDGVVEDTKGASGTALVTEFNRGYTTISEENVVKAFDLTTLASLGTIPVGEDPDCIVYDSASKLVFSCGANGAITAIDAASGNVVATIEVPSKKVEYAAVDGKGHLYVNLRDKGQVAVIDTKTLKVETLWSMNRGNNNTPMAIDAEKGRLFVGCRNSWLTVLDTKDGSILAELPILGFNPDSVIYDPVTKLIFVACMNGVITVYQETAKGGYVVADSVLSKDWAKTMALDPKTHSIYIAAAQTGKYIPKKTWPELVSNTFSVFTISK